MDPESQDIIDQIIEDEGGSRTSSDPVDSGGRTKFGISETANPDLWVSGPPTIEQAENRFFTQYVKGPKFDHIENIALRHQLVDFGVTSGPRIAIQTLQVILKVTPDGVLGPESLHALSGADVNAIKTSLVKARVLMLCKICVKTPSQLHFLVGWVDRAMSFLA